MDRQKIKEVLDMLAKAYEDLERTKKALVEVGVELDKLMK